MIGTVFEAILSIFLAIGPYRSVRTADRGHTFQGADFWAGRTTVQTWHVFRGRIFGGCFSVL
jgi:hypothetical protein